MKIIAANAIKGGVGKTSTLSYISRATAKYLAETERGKVLIIDLDANRSATIANLKLSTIKKVDMAGKHIANALFTNDDLVNFIVPTIYENLYIIPGTVKITDVQMSDLMLKNLINSSSLQEFEYIFIDTPATFYQLHQMALTAADLIITPVNLDYFNLESTTQLKYKILRVLGKDGLDKWKIFINRRRSKLTNEDQEYLDAFMNLRDVDGSLMFNNFLATVFANTSFVRKCIDQRYFVSKNKTLYEFNRNICQLASEVTGEKIDPEGGF